MLFAKETKIKESNLVIAPLSVQREIAISVPLTLPHLTLHPSSVLIWGLLDPVLQCVLPIFVFPDIDHCGEDVNLNDSRRGYAFKTDIVLRQPIVHQLCLSYQKVESVFHALPSSSTITYSILSLSCKCPNWGARRAD